MPTLKEDKEIRKKARLDTIFEKSLRNEMFGINRGYITEDTFLIIGKHIFDPKKTSLSYTGFFISVFSDFFVDVMIVEYLREKGVITSDRCSHLKKISQDMTRSLILKVLDPETTHPIDEDWDRADEYFLNYIHPIAWYNADTIFKINKVRIDTHLTKCKCGKIFVAQRTKTVYCPKCQKKVHVHNFRMRNTKVLEEKTCEYEHCPKMFTPKRSTARFCSDACRVYSFRKNKVTSLS